MCRRLGKIPPILKSIHRKSLIKREGLPRGSVLIPEIANTFLNPIVLSGDHYEESNDWS
jgi:hypothetical protein